MIELNVVKRLKEIQKKLIELADKQVVVGAIDNSTREDGLTNADLLAIHEFGVATKGIPERPVMRTALAKNAQGVHKLLSTGIAECLRGNTSSNAVYERVGVFTKNAVIDAFTENDFTPLKAKTIERKKSSKPLIDTGALRASINFEVRNRE